MQHLELIAVLSLQKYQAYLQVRVIHFCSYQLLFFLKFDCEANL